MAYKPGILLGQIIKTIGFEGAVLVKLQKQFIDNIPDCESVFLEVDGRPVPFFISWSEYQGADVLKLTFIGYGSLKKVEEFRGCRVFLSDNSQASDTETDFDLLKNFTLVNQDNEAVGRIAEIKDNAGQLLLTIITDSGGEILIPLHESLIISIDKRRKRIRMDLPEGLTGINS